MDSERRGDVEFKLNDPKQPIVLPMEYEMWIDAPREVVWDRAIRGIDDWWPHRFKPEGLGLFFEARVGGVFEERFDDQGNGCQFATVVYCDPPRAIGTFGQYAIFGATTSGGTWVFEEKDGGTLMKVRGEVMGALPEEMIQGREQGSVAIMHALKRFIEDGVKFEKKPRDAG